MTSFVLAPVMDLLAPRGGEVVSQALLGDEVSVLGPDRDGWVGVESGGERGFGLASLQGAWPAAARERWVASPEALGFHQPTRRAGAPSWRLPLGARLPAEPADRDENGFVAVAVRGVRAWVQREDLAESPPRAPTPAERLAVARSLLGRPYVWGGCTSLGSDCSGLVKLLGRLAGVGLPHSAARQSRLRLPGFEAVEGLARAQPGDFVYLRPDAPDTRVDHVVVWEGGGSVLHASAEGGPPAVRREPWAAVAPRGVVAAVRRLVDTPDRVEPKR